MSENMTCTKMVSVQDGVDQNGKPRFYHARCGLPASEVEISGSLTTAKAVLCARHHKLADRSAFISERGWPKGKTKKVKTGEKPIEQIRIIPAVRRRSDGAD